MEHKRPSCSKRWVSTTKCMKAPNRTSSSPSGNALAAGAKDHGSSRAAVRTRGNGVRFRVKGASERLKENRERAHHLTPNPKARPHPIYPIRFTRAVLLGINIPLVFPGSYPSLILGTLPKLRKMALRTPRFPMNDAGPCCLPPMPHRTLPEIFPMQTHELIA